jgi:cytochrome c biogenesis protein CcdA
MEHRAMELAFKALLFGVGFAIPLLTIAVVFSPVLRPLLERFREAEGDPGESTTGGD